MPRYKAECSKEDSHVLFWCFHANLSWTELERGRERDGRRGGFTYQTSLLFIIELQLCADRQPRFKQTPPFDSMLTWRHVIGMCPNIRLLQLTLYSSTHSLIKPKLHAALNSWEGPGMSFGSVQKFVRFRLDSFCRSLLSSHPPIVAPRAVCISVCYDESWCWMVVCVLSVTTAETSTVGRYEYFNDPHS